MKMYSKIAEILSKVDEEIEKTDKIIGKNEQLRNGLILELFGSMNVKFCVPINNTNKRAVVEI